MMITIIETLASVAMVFMALIDAACVAATGSAPLKLETKKAKGAK